MEKISAESMSWVMYPLSLFMLQNKPKPEKCYLTVYTISHCILISPYTWVGGRWWMGVEVKLVEATKKTYNLVAAKTQLFIRQLLVSQPLEDFLPEAKLVEFCM